MEQVNSEMQAAPLMPEEMEQLFPSIEWGNLRNEKEMCAVCLEDFEYNAKVRKLICEHIFHAGCIDEWAKTKAKCPLCKKILIGEEIRTDSALILPESDSQSESVIREENQINEESKEEAKEESQESEEDTKRIEEEYLNNAEENENIKEDEISGYKSEKME